MGSTLMSAYEFTVSLRIRHPTMDPSRITETLGVNPQHTWRAGDPRRDPGGGELEGMHRDSYWMGRLMDDPQLSSQSVSVEGMLLQTLVQLERSRQLFERIQAEGGVAELHVSLFARTNFRLELPADSLASLGRLGLAIALEIHP
jgi:Domain of unknown function (DUF4279)